MIDLTEAEWKIMELLWDEKSLTTMEIIKEMNELHGWAKSTVITVLNRMTRKGSILYEKEGKTKKYTSAITRQEAKLQETKSFLEKFYDGNIGLLISNLVSEEALNKEQIEEIQKIINEGK